MRGSSESRENTEARSSTFQSRLLVAWLAGSAIVFVLAGLSSLFLAVGLEALVLVPSGLVAGAGSFTHGLVLAAHVALWGIIAGSVVVATGRIVLPESRPLGSRNVFVFGLGVTLAAGTELALHEWARSRFAYFEPQLVGITSLLPAVILAHACLWAAAAVATRAWRALPVVGIGATSLAIFVIVAANVPGAGDGIRPGSVPLASAIAVSIAYVALTSAIALAQWKQQFKGPSRGQLSD